MLGMAKAGAGDFARILQLAHAAWQPQLYRKQDFSQEDD